jgi:hypothetical protein
MSLGFLTNSTLAMMVNPAFSAWLTDGFQSAERIIPVIPTRGASLPEFIQDNPAVSTRPGYL